MEVSAPGFRPYMVEVIDTDVARTSVYDVRLELGEFAQEITVRSQAAMIDRATTSVGHVIDGRTVQEIPLNGRYFLDLASLVPGSVTRRRMDFQPRPAAAWAHSRLTRRAIARRRSTI